MSEMRAVLACRPPIGYELQRSMDMGVEIGGVDLAERQVIHSKQRQ